MSYRKLSILFNSSLFFCLLFLSLNAFSNEVKGDIHFVLNNSVKIEIPYGWTIRNKSEIAGIKEASSNLLNQKIDSITSLAADTRYDNYYMSTRVSFRKQNNYYSQSDFETELNLYGYDSYLREQTIEVKQDFKKLKNSMISIGADLDLEGLKCSIGNIAGRTDFVIQYNRTEPYLPNNIIYVEQNHIFNGAEAIIITFSYDRKCSYCKQVISKIRNSIHFL